MICIKESCYLKNKHLQIKGGLSIQSDKEISNEAFKEIYQKLELKYPKFYKMDGMSKSAFLTAEALISKRKPDVAKEKVGIFLMNKSSSLDTDESYYDKTFAQSEITANPALFVYTLPNIMLGELSIRHGFKGEQSMWINDHFDSENMANYVNLLFEEGAIEGAIIGWVEFYRGVENVFLSWLESKGDSSEAYAEFNAESIETIYNQLNSY